MIITTIANKNSCNQNGDDKEWVNEAVRKEEKVEKKNRLDKINKSKTIIGQKRTVKRW